MADALHEADAPPPVPGFWRLGWLLFMQPLTLHRLSADWGFGRDSPWQFATRFAEGDPVARPLLARLTGWLVLVVVATNLSVAGCLVLAGLPIDWRVVAVGAAFVVLIYGTAGSIAFDFSFRGASLRGVAGAFSAAGSGILLGIVSGIAFSISFGVTEGPAVGIAVGVAIGVALALVSFQLPFFPVEIALTAALRLTASWRPDFLPRLAAFLPYRHHELIYFPLPFLAGFLVRLGEADKIEGRRALAEAAASLGQKSPARRALVELRACSLERAAREKQYASAAALALPFLSQSDSLPIIASIATAARDLGAARATTSHHQSRQALLRARQELQRTLDRLTSAPSLTRDERRSLPVVKVWLDRVADEEAALATLERESPQVPLVFVAGVPLTPADESLFVGRTDLVRLLDQDLAAERPVPLVLLGQRRMGKSTLLNFLPRLLGTGTRVVRLDFQSLSGHPLRGEPHRWVTAEVMAALASEKIEAVSAPPEEAPWMATLDWLSALEEPLAASGRQLLIALDEVEGLERGIREKWSDPAFLDFLRAAGDRLRRIRFLLVTAHPFSRLGPHWSDRLISAQTRRIEPLAEEEARVLLTRPVDGFPDIYPMGGVERLLAETACHPYLLQLSAYNLTRRLNDSGLLKATDDDVTAALDQALEENNLFQNLWDDLTAAEQRLVAALARGEEPAEEAAETLSQARRKLAGEQLIQRDGDGEGWRVAVPLFARWIREIGAAG